MKHFTLMATLMAVIAIALPGMSRADECVNLTTLKENIVAATEGDMHITQEFSLAMLPVMEANEELFLALSMEEEAEEAAVQARRLKEGAVTTSEDIKQSVEISKRAQEKFADAAEKGIILDDSSKVHLKNACSPLIEGLIRTSRFGKAAVEYPNQLKGQMETAANNLKELKSKVESAGRLQKVRLAKDVVELAREVNRLKEEVSLAVSIAEVLPGYVEMFLGNYGKLAKLLADNGVDMPTDVTSVI